MSARIKLMLSIAVLIAFIVLVPSILSYIQINKSSTEDYQNNLTNKSFLLSKALEQKIETYFVELESISSVLRFVDNKVLVGEKLIDILVKNKEHMGVLNVFVGKPDGTTYAASTKGIIPNFNAKEKQREWYIKGMSGKPRTITKPFMATTGNLTMALVTPVKVNGEVAAIIGMSLKMSDITDYVNELSSEPNIFVTRADGYTMAASYPELVGTDLFESRPSYRQYVGKPSSSHYYNVPDKGNFFVVSSKIESLDWTVWAWATETDIKATSRDTVLTNAISGLVFIVLSVITVYYLITKLMYTPIGGEPSEIEVLVNRIAGGDLTNIPAVDESSKGVYRSTLLMANNLKQIIANINHSVSQLVESSTKLGESSNKVENASASQTMQLEQLATAMNEMSVTVAEVAQNAVEASNSSDGASNTSKQGMAVVEEMNQEISHLVSDITEVQNAIINVNQETANVGSILDVIRGISEQTNLLALNAAIEAARAGEHGRGFAVVADEVRTLATKTQDSTNEIQAMIEQLQQQATRSVDLMSENAQSASRTLDKANEANSALVEIENEIQIIKDMNNQIATAAEEQSSVAAEINETVVNVNDLATATASDVQENVTTADQLNQLANSLGEAVSKFKV